MAEKKKHRVLLPLWVKLESYEEAVSVMRYAVVICGIMAFSEGVSALHNGLIHQHRLMYAALMLFVLFAALGVQIYRRKWYGTISFIAVWFMIEGLFRIVYAVDGFSGIIGAIFMLAGFSVFKAWRYVRRHAPTETGE
ncbi:MAG: hypothetical protein GC134_00655 [Proteobacteria bacterium]|nr:hypothetical protein [Pseudomonadota bacterium]